MFSWINEKLFSLCIRIPVFGGILLVLNAYVSNGDALANTRFAKPFEWIFKFVLPLFFSAAATVFLSPPELVKSCNSCSILHINNWIITKIPDWLVVIVPDWLVERIPNFFMEVINKPINECVVSSGINNIGGEIISIFPNLLGFGIGVYALVFGLSTDFIKDIQEEICKNKLDGRSSTKTILVLNAEMAYPLLVIALTIVAGVISKSLHGNEIVEFCTFILFWYALIMIFELLITLFNTGEALLMRKAAKKEKVSEPLQS